MRFHRTDWAWLVLARALAAIAAMLAIGTSHHIGRAAIEAVTLAPGIDVRAWSDALLAAS